jgi:hypothetical protein
MRIDYEYIAKMLDVFLESELPNIDFNSFKNELDEDSNKFFFHLILLEEQGLVAGSSSDPSNIGVRFNGNTGDYMTWIAPLRLTSYGHEFADALAKPSVTEVIMDKFQKEGLSAVIDVAKKLAIKQTEKLLQDAIS